MEPELVGCCSLVAVVATISFLLPPTFDDLLFDAFKLVELLVELLDVFDVVCCCWSSATAAVTSSGRLVVVSAAILLRVEFDC